MHTISELGTSVPAFLAKLWKLVEDPETDDLICWSPNGRSFFIRNQAQFARELLPHYYKHNNMASFVRQLNMYGFHKKVSVELGGLKCDRDEMEFAHQFFCKGHPYLVDHIKRKIASSKGQDPTVTPIKPELMSKVLTEVRSMRGRQEHLDSRLGAMKRENEALWRELAMLRQKHLKQQQIVNKLIHFLVTLVQGTDQPTRGGLSVKRRYPLMIDDSNRQRSKQAKLSKPQASPTGPVIHELDASEHDMDSEFIVAEMLDTQQNPAIESPEHNAASEIDDDNMETIQLIDDSGSLDGNLQLISQQETDSKKKRTCKGRKKRKNKVPVKILIPSTQNGEEPREETHMLEMPDEAPVTIALLNSKPVALKAVPVATVRSSKLAAMAANMGKNPDVENDIDSESVDIKEEARESNPGPVKFGQILIVPKVIDGNHIERHESSGKNEDNYSEVINNDNDIVDLNNGGDIVDTGKQANSINDMPQSPEEEKQLCYSPGTSTSKYLPLSRVNSLSGFPDATYRLGSTEEMDSHLGTIQTDLENLRDILRGEGYSIDANTLLGLFGADDPMTFGIPVNPELNPHCDKEDEDHNIVGESTNGNMGGELMAYNPPPSLLDFDDDIFLGGTSSSPINNITPDMTSNSYTTDPLDLGDNKAMLLESLVENDLNLS